MAVTMSKALSTLKIRGRLVGVDDIGRICLADIHKAGQFTVNQKPSDWGALRETTKFVAVVAEKRSGKSGPLSKDDIKSVYCVKPGRGGGIWAHPIIALAYAKYLSPSLHYEVNEVFLRYKAADATLADDVLERGTPEGNEWAARRAIGRVVRNQYTRVLDEHGVSAGFQFGNCTNETYLGLFDKTAKGLKEERGLKPTANLRDKMSMKEIAFIAAAEALSVERIEDEKAQGYPECRKATAKSSRAIRAAIEADRKDRANRLV